MIPYQSGILLYNYVHSMNRSSINNEAIALTLGLDQPLAACITEISLLFEDLLDVWYVIAQHSLYLSTAIIICDMANDPCMHTCTHAHTRERTHTQASLLVCYLYLPM